MSRYHEQLIDAARVARPRVAIVPVAETAALQRKLATDLFWRYVESLKDRTAPKRDAVPRYLRAQVDYEGLPNG